MYRCSFWASLQPLQVWILKEKEAFLDKKKKHVNYKPFKPNLHFIHNKTSIIVFINMRNILKTICRMIKLTL